MECSWQHAQPRKVVAKIGARHAAIAGRGLLKDIVVTKEHHLAEHATLGSETFKSAMSTDGGSEDVWTP